MAAPASTCLSTSGNIGPDVIDIRKLYGTKRHVHLRPGLLCPPRHANSAITYIDGDKGELLYRGYPIEQLANNCRLLGHLLLVAERRAACRPAKQRLPQTREPAHHGQRADAILLAWFPARRAPHGRVDVGTGRRIVGLLPRQHRHQQPGSPPHCRDPLDRQNAHAWWLDGVQIRRGPAVHVPPQRPVLRWQLLCA